MPISPTLPVFISQKPRFAGFKEPERERIAKHFTNNFNLDMLDRY